jgi:hypothetical protein
MSEEWVELHNEVLPGEWWWLSVVFMAMWQHRNPCPKYPHNFTTHADGWEGTPAMEQDGQQLGTIRFTEAKSTTKVRIVAPSAFQSYWDEIMGELFQHAHAAQGRRRIAWGSTPEGLVEYYYRSRARGSRVTLKQIADQTGFNYDYLRKVKARHDRAGKYGSRKAQNRPGDE